MSALMLKEKHSKDMPKKSIFGFKLAVSAMKFIKPQ